MIFFSSESVTRFHSWVAMWGASWSWRMSALKKSASDFDHDFDIKFFWLKSENKFFFGVITRPASQGPESSPGKIIMVLTTNATTATTMLTLNEGSEQR